MSDTKKTAAEKKCNVGYLYIYLTSDGSLIGIRGKRKPSVLHKGMYVVYELIDRNKWAMAVFPELPPARLNRFVFIGNVPLSIINFL